MKPGDVVRVYFVPLDEEYYEGDAKLIERVTEGGEHKGRKIAFWRLKFKGETKVYLRKILEPAKPEEEGMEKSIEELRRAVLNKVMDYIAKRGKTPSDYFSADAVFGVEDLAQIYPDSEYAQYVLRATEEEWASFQREWQALRKEEESASGLSSTLSKTHKQ